MAEAPVVRLRDVTKSYGEGAGKAQVLRGVSFDIEKGELIALVGQSGSGKSTLLNIIGGLDRPDAGEVEVLGVDAMRASDTTWAKMRNESIGFVFQAFNLLDHLTVLDNVILPSSFSRNSRDIKGRGREALRRVGLSDFANRKPGEMSGGQAQRVAVARAMVTEPAVVFADEPTGSLDSLAGEQVMELLTRAAGEQGTSIVLVTHEPRVAAYAHREVIVRDGRVSGPGAA